jgi:hypothetical protein
MRDLAAEAKKLLEEQKREWPLLRDNVAALGSVQTRAIEVDDFVLKVQFNPARLTSTAAKTDATSIRGRKCFLCDANRPPEQRSIAFGENYKVLCNPFPIFPEHFTITHHEHRPQRIDQAFGDLLDLAQAMQSRYTVFYNGPRCGASAPDHLHFQAGDRGFMTIEGEYDRLKGEPIVRFDTLEAEYTARNVKPIAKTRDIAVFAPKSSRPFIGLESSDRDGLVYAFGNLSLRLNRIARAPDEPMMNVLTWYEPDGWRVIVFPRLKHRPSFYFAEGDEKILLSPASVDLGGVSIVPLEHDFHKLDRAHLEQMLREVMLPADAFASLSDELARVLR